MNPNYHPQSPLINHNMQQRDQNLKELTRFFASEIRLLKEQIEVLQSDNAKLYDMIIMTREHFAPKVPNSKKVDLIQEFFKAIFDAKQSLNFSPNQSLCDLFAQKENIYNILWPKMETEPEMNTNMQEVNVEVQPYIPQPEPPKLNILFWMMTGSNLPSYIKMNTHYRCLESVTDIGSGQGIVFVMNAAGRSLDDELVKTIKLMSESK